MADMSHECESNRLILVKWEDSVDLFMLPLVKFLSRYKIHSNALIGLMAVLNCCAAALFFKQDLRFGGMLIAAGAFLGMLSVLSARCTQPGSAVRTLRLSALSRYSEITVYFGLIFYYLGRGGFYHSGMLLVIALAVLGTVFLSDLTSNAYALGRETDEKLLQRPEIFLALGLGALINEFVLAVILMIIAVLLNVTAFQSFINFQNISQKAERDVK